MQLIIFIPKSIITLKLPYTNFRCSFNTVKRGLLTSLFEGDTNGYEYPLAAVDGDLVSVISEDKSAEQGQCVSVRVAGDVRIRLELWPLVKKPHKNILRLISDRNKKASE
ncbi:hypothetical protein [Paraglaciecola sp. MB-3u-78]|uniref:hypothetical protein n=1 Tax=Paraglaciecola sp. MB-3u-78 TaxID=2058332 RepID=UPI000C31E81A|nr:hypothetical protein [Paraglaciecola sp. MB-3u-78]PKG97305.1 hypothetical protein CXF95_20415 [Paraglaciecola sp. MB-3u-78]